VDVERFQPSSRGAKKNLVIFSMGRLVPRKGIDTVLRVLPAIAIKFPEIEYRIGGDGPDRARLEQLVSELNLQDKVNFLGRIEPEDLPFYFSNSDVFIMPVRGDPRSVEGFGIVYLEASASGLPVIAGRSDGAVEAVRHNETGILVDPNNSDEVTDALVHLLSDPELRIRMGAAGREWVKTGMSWEHAASQLAEAIR
jgi:phosphatidylinositol alpha-1,6-mannosyltransferase